VKTRYKGRNIRPGGTRYVIIMTREIVLFPRNSNELTANPAKQPANSAIRVLHPATRKLFFSHVKNLVCSNKYVKFSRVNGFGK
jgi:hypothetical protein